MGDTDVSLMLLYRGTNCLLQSHRLSNKKNNKKKTSQCQVSDISLEMSEVSWRCSTLRTTQPVVIVLGCPPELAGKTPFLITPHTSDVVKMVLIRNRLLC